MSKRLLSPFQSTFRSGRILMAIVCLVVVIYLFAPMVISIIASFNAGGFIEVPPNGWSLRWYAAVLEDPRWMNALGLSFQISLSAALIATISSFLAVTGITRSPRLARMMRPVFFLPMVLPVIVLALGFSRLQAFMDIRSNIYSVILGEALLCTPIVFISISAGMVNIDPALRRAASSLGASWWRTVLTIDLPLLRQSIFAGFILAFAFSFDEAVLGLFLAPAGMTPLPVMLYNEAYYHITPLISAVSGYVIILTIVVAAIALTINSLLGRRSRRVA